MRFNTSYLGGDIEWYDGLPATSLVPYSFPISLNGVPFMVDFSQPFYRQYRRQMASVVRTQADVGDQPGEQSMDPNGLWRRSVEDWTLGAGQRYLDRKQSGALSSVPNGFWQSKGVDVSTKWQMTLLPDTQRIYSSAAGNLQAVNVGGTLYVADGDTLKFSTNPDAGTPSFTTVTGTSTNQITSICTDGWNVYLACQAAGLYTTTKGASSATQMVTSALDADAVVFYANGRLMIANERALYNITGSGALPAALFTAGPSNFRYNSFASGTAAIYVSGNTVASDGTLGGGGQIFAITIQSDGTTLNAPSLAGSVTAEETIGGMYFYLNNLVLYTSLGLRVCTVESDATVTLGSLIQVPPASLLTNASNHLMTGGGKDGRFVYFPWVDYDTTSTGIGRVDLSNFVDPPVLPAYHSYLMAASQGDVTSIAAFGNNVLFTVVGEGVYAPTSDLVASGSIDSGNILYDLVDAKIATFLDVRSEGPLTAGSYDALISTDNGDFESVGVHAAGQQEPVSFSTDKAGERFEVRLILNADTIDPTSGPKITRWTLRSYPAPIRPLTWQLPLLINEEQTNMSGTTEGYQPLSQIQALEGMLNSRKMVIFQEGNSKFPVFVSDCAFLPDTQTENKTWFNGIALLTLLGIPNNS